MAIINTGLLEKGVRSEFSKRFGDQKTHFQDLTTRIASTSDRETYKWLGSTPRMREWGTGRLTRGLRTESYSVENLKYESTLEVDRDELADDRTGQIQVRIGELAERAATHKDFLLAQLLTNGATAGFLAFDGKTFFATDHVSGKSGNQSNDLAATAATPTNPTTVEFKEAIKSAVSAILGFKDDVGDPIALSSSGMMIVVPPNLMWAAMEAVNASVISNTSNVLQGAARVITFPWLTGQDKFYLVKSDAVIRPFIFQDREPIELVSLTEGSDESFRREKFLFGVRGRYAISYALWSLAVRVTFA